MDTAETLAKGRIPKWLLPAIGYGISAVSLFWVFSKFPFAQLGNDLRRLEWSWVVLAIMVEVGVYVVDAWRWKVLLRPVGTPEFSCCVQSVFVGLFANTVLPARAGEVIRCFLLSYKTEVPLSLALTSDLILRIMDGWWVVILYLISKYDGDTHTDVERVVWGFGAGVAIASLVLLWILFHRQHAHNFFSNRSWAARFMHLLEEIHRLGSWRELGAAMLISGIYWIGQVVAIYLVAKGAQFDFSTQQMCFVLAVKTLGTLIPNAPGSLGVYQASLTLALMRLYTERANAQSLSQIVFGSMTLPLLVCGAIAVAMAGFNISDLHRHAHHAHSTRRLTPKPQGGPADGSG